APASFMSRTRMRSTPSCSASVATMAGPMIPAAPTTATVGTLSASARIATDRGERMVGRLARHRLRHLDPRLVEHGVEDVVDEVEVVARRHERRRELNDRVAAVVSAADQAGVVEPPRQEPAQE